MLKVIMMSFIEVKGKIKQTNHSAENTSTNMIGNNNDRKKQESE